MAFHDLFIATAAYGVKASDGSSFTEGDSLSNQMDSSTAAKSLAEGSVAIFDEKGQFISNSSSGLIGNSQFVRFAVGRGATVAPFLSELVKTDAHVGYQAYAAGSDCVQFVGEDDAGNFSLNLPSVLTAGESAGLQVTRMHDMTMLRQVEHTYETTVQPSDTAAAILGRLITQIEAERQYTIAAELVNTDKGLKITSDENLAIGVYGALEWADVVTPDTDGASATTSYAKPPINNYERLDELYRQATVDQGNTDGTSGYRWRLWSESNPFTDTTKQYNIINFSWELQPEQIGETIRRVRKQSLNIAADIATDAGVGSGKMITVIDPILTSIFDSADII